MNKEIVERILTMLEETLRWYRENKTDELELRDRELSYKERALSGTYDAYLKWIEKQGGAQIGSYGTFKIDPEKAEAFRKEAEELKRQSVSEEKTDEHIEQDFEGEPEYAPIPNDASLFDEAVRIENELNAGEEEEKTETVPDPVFTPWSLQRFKEILKANEEREESLVKAGGDDAPEDLRSADASLTRKYRTSIKKQLDYWVNEKRLTGYKTGARTHTLENTLMSILTARDDLARSADHISLPEKEDKEDGGYIFVGPEGAALAEHITTKGIAEHVKKTVAEEQKTESEMKVGSETGVTLKEDSFLPEEKPVAGSEFPEEQLKLLDNPDVPSNNKQGIAIGAEEFELISLKYISIYKVLGYAEFIKGIALYRNPDTGEVRHITGSPEICVSQYAMLTDAMCIKVKTSFSDILTEK